MKALAFLAKNKVGVLDKPIPEPGPTDAVVKTTAARIPLGGSVAVFAQGPVGLCATAGARMLGAALVIAVEAKPDRQALAKRFGADVIVDPSKEDAVARIVELSGGPGVDSAIEAL